ncbi:CpaE-like family protein [Parenemella sanctibonifatiensis]|uniref:Uncharacterized protein n=1 Tax=Parenemella sanctibonifatiensis TaxID=2016505 RepID=A0A255EGK0_9ACTN|nr:hypothetical protein [Parenemella sanctibonifatiensis]OYN90657.1 hypothetical protein CGZ92_00465 [Parenemella sanctibonifatiensis]
MTTIAILGSGGAPGATTLALAFGAAWPGESLVIDANPVPDHSVLAGFLRGEQAPSAGLFGLSSSLREGSEPREALRAGLMRLPAAPGPDRWFLPGFPHPGSAEHFAGGWRAVGHAIASLTAEDPRRGFILDLGRDPRLPDEIDVLADEIWLVCRGDLRGLASARLQLGALREADPTPPVSLIMVGDSPYADSEIEEQLTVHLRGVIPHDPAAAGHYSHGTPAPRRLARSAWWRRVTELSAAAASDTRRRTAA